MNVSPINQKNAVSSNRIFGFLVLCEETSNDPETKRPVIHGLLTEVLSNRFPSFLKATVFASLSRVDTIESMFLRVLDGSTGAITDQIDLYGLLPLAEHDQPMDIQLDFPFIVRAPGTFQLVLVANDEIAAMTMFVSRNDSDVSRFSQSTDQ